MEGSKGGEGRRGDMERYGMWSGSVGKRGGVTGLPRVDLRTMTEQ